MYERVTYRRGEGKRAITVILGGVRVVSTVIGDFLSGIEVTDEGETRWFNKGTTERRHLVDVLAIDTREPLTMNLHYGILESTSGDALQQER